MCETGIVGTLFYNGCF